MIKRYAPVFLLLLSSCGTPEPSGVRAIVGAKLQPGAGKPEIEYSVVVVEGGTFRAVGPQATTPVPKDAELIEGRGKVVEPAAGGLIEAGQPADLVLRSAASGSVESTMRNGQWAK